MMAPFFDYTVNQTFERLMAEARIERAAHPRVSLLQRLVQALSGLRWQAA
jgi:hypothetical protein